MPRLASLLVAASIAVATPASAAPWSVGVSRMEPSDDDIAKAEKLRKEAIEAFSSGDLEQAAQTFERAYDLDPSPAYLFNIGRVYEEMGRLEDALEYYERFSRQPRLTLDERAQAAERIEVLRRLVKDGAGEDEPPPDEGESTEPEDPPPDDEEPGPPKKSRPLIVAGSALLGTGAAIGLGGGLGFGLAARNRSRRISDITEGQNPEGLTLTEVEDLDAEGRTFELYQILTAATGGALAVTGAVLLGVGMSRRAKGTPQRAQIQPMLGRTASGIRIVGRF